MSVKNKATMIKYSRAEDGCFPSAIRDREPDFAGEGV